MSEPTLKLSVILPARNEQDCLADCLRSLTAQSEPVFALGVDWELIVVDDHSTDDTRRIAEEFAGVTVIAARPLEKGWTGKANAIMTAVDVARGEWFLFTDADTVHELGNLKRALHEAEKYAVGMLSYSPRQIVQGTMQRALMPLVFSELASAYPPAKVSDPNARIAAANGQFLLVSREGYEKVGTHRAVAGSILEDVALATLAKRRKVGLRFRYAPDALSTRMYRTTTAMMEGWTKNLALLFGNALALAAWRALDFALLIGLPWFAIVLWHQPAYAISVGAWARWVLVVMWLRTLWRFYVRVARSNFPALDCALTPLGLPVFVWLLYKSWFDHTVTHRVAWKGRTYKS